VNPRVEKLEAVRESVGVLPAFFLESEPLPKPTNLPSGRSALPKAKDMAGERG
jgi:hypothetical protein